MKYNHTKIEQKKLNSGGLDPALQLADRFGCLRCLWRVPFALEPTEMMNKHVGALSSSLFTQLVLTLGCSTHGCKHHWAFGR